MSYRWNMTDRQIARAAMKILRENATLIGDANDSNRVWDLINVVDCDNDTKPKNERI